MNVKTTNRETNILYFRHVYMYYALTLRTTEEPKETSPDTLRLSSSTILGMDLNQLRKLDTCYKDAPSDAL